MNSFTSTAAMLRDDPAVEVGAINCERAENRKICADWLAVDSYPSLYLLNRYLLLPAPTCSYLTPTRRSTCSTGATTRSQSIPRTPTSPQSACTRGRSRRRVSGATCSRRPTYSSCTSRTLPYAATHRILPHPPACPCRAVTGFARRRLASPRLRMPPHPAIRALLRRPSLAWHVQSEVVEDERRAWVVLFTDGIACAPCRSAFTNAMRLSASVRGLPVAVGYVDCEIPSAQRLCEQHGLPQRPHAPEWRAWPRGGKAASPRGDALFDDPEMEPHRVRPRPKPGPTACAPM